jgi:hypothetical protein
MLRGTRGLSGKKTQMVRELLVNLWYGAGKERGPNAPDRKTREAAQRCSNGFPGPCQISIPLIAKMNYVSGQHYAMPWRGLSMVIDSSIGRATKPKGKRPVEAVWGQCAAATQLA